ncbi:MAG: LytR/AlgR family response regulator transcription factor [Cellulosilyticaceae bacterium]
MIQILICEDDALLLEYTRGKMIEALSKSGIEYSMGCYQSSKVVMEDISSFEKHKIIALLDIDLDREEDGFRVAKRLRGHYGEDVTIIFMTSYSEYVFKCFDYEPLGFIRKKHMEEELPILLKKAIYKTMKQSQVVTVLKTVQGEVKLRENDIMYFEKVGRCVRVKTTQGTYDITYQLSDIQDNLDTHKFIMIYRSVIVNMEYVLRVEKDQVILEDGEALPMSRYRAKQVKEAFQLYL